MTRTVVESKTKSVIIGFDQPFCVIGERINPTGRKRLAAELEAGDFSTVESDAIAQVLAGANILDMHHACAVWTVDELFSTFDAARKYFLYFSSVF